MAKKTYTISEDSGRLLDALDAYQAFIGEFINALVEIYGDGNAQDLYLKDLATFEAVEDVIMRYLRIQFTTQGMGTGKTEVTI